MIIILNGIDGCAKPIQFDENKSEILINTIDEIINKRARFNKDIDMYKMWDEYSGKEVEMYEILIQFEKNSDTYQNICIYKNPSTYIINYWYEINKPEKFEDVYKEKK